MSNTDTQPTSFRLPAEVLDALDEGAKRFGMSRTDWLAFLAKAGVAEKKSYLAKDENEITVVACRRK